MANLSAVGMEARKLCKEFPTAQTRTLAKRLAKSHKTTLERARSILRQCRGAMGKTTLKYATTVRPKQKAGWVPEIPPAIENPWDTFDTGNNSRVLVLSDLHVPYHSPLAISEALKYGRDRKPHVVLIDGDLCDFYTISRFQKNPKLRNLLKEIDDTQKMLSEIRRAFPKAQIVFKLGNHDERWRHWLWNSAAEICDSPRMELSEWLDTKKHGIDVVDDKRPVKCGNLTVFHGHEFGGGTGGVNPARTAYLRTGITVMVGHSHRSNKHSESNCWHDATVAWSTGCLCDRRPDFAKVNKWDWGFGFVDVDSNGDFHVDNLQMGKDGRVW